MSRFCTRVMWHWRLSVLLLPQDIGRGTDRAGALWADFCRSLICRSARSIYRLAQCLARHSSLYIRSRLRWCMHVRARLWCRALLEGRTLAHLTRLGGCPRSAAAKGTSRTFIASQGATWTVI